MMLQCCSQLAQLTPEHNISISFERHVMEQFSSGHSQIGSELKGATWRLPATSLLPRRV